MSTQIRTAQEFGPANLESITFSGRDAIIRELNDLEWASSHLSLDLSNIPIIGSLELSALIQFCLRLREIDGCVVIRNVSPEVRRVFELTRFDRLVEIQSKAS